MPIRPEMRARYPKNWAKEIVPAVRKRSRNRCECRGHCGINHGGKDGKARCKARNKHKHPTTGSTVVLTVMHLNHRPEDCAMGNLLHGCQQCHNRYDAPMRREGIKARARAACASGDLFEDRADALLKIMQVK
jgi:hypothetical protein